MPDLTAHSLLLPVLPLKDACLFPESSLTAIVTRPYAQKTLDIAARLGGQVLALAQREGAGGAAVPNPRDLHAVGTVALVSADETLPDETRRVELDGLRRGRVVTLIGLDTLIAEVELLDEGEPGDEWGPAVEALARYMHSHPDLRTFLDEQRRSKQPMAWVNLACQHLPIAASARQRLLETDATERCVKISRGLDALLRKEKGD